MKIHIIDKNDVLGQEDILKQKSMLSNSRSQTTPHDAFSLGRRMEQLRNPTHGAITAYVAEDDKSTHYLEVPFRAFNLALLDNASFEYTFLAAYLGSSQSLQAISRTFNSVFEPTFALAQSLTKQLIDSTTDALGILLCVRLNQQFAFELQRRKIPAMEGYINGTNMLLWPRFQMVMDLHCESFRKLSSALSNRSGTSPSLITSSSGGQSTAPHPLTQRFASFLHGILAISKDAGDDEPVAKSLSRLGSEFEAYLTRLSKTISEQRKRERFLFNNYSLVGTIIADTDGKMADNMKTHFSALKDAFTNDT
jgi:vacuolar protein sorting-associated protein 52